MTQIDVYADVCCPFAHVGLRTVLRRRKELGRHDVVVRVRAWPLELVNGRPLDPDATRAHADALRSQVASDLYADFDEAEFPETSLPALTLESAAYRQDPTVGEAISRALRDALFEEGRNIADPAVLADIANRHGLRAITPPDEDAVRNDWHEGEARGVVGSPHFFCGSLEAFCPSLDIKKDQDGALHVHRNMTRLDEFLAECFTQN